MVVIMKMLLENTIIQFMQTKDGENPVDTFFANFNWGKAETDYSISTAKWINTQSLRCFGWDRVTKGGSYKTNVDWDAILDENGNSVFL